MENQKNPEKSISDQLLSILPRLTKDQLRFVVAMQEFPTKKQAAEQIEIEPDTVYRWPDIVDEAIKLIALDITESARIMRKKSIAKAMAVKLAGLDSDDERIRQAVATEIIEAEFGKPKQAVEHSLDDDQFADIVRIVKHGDDGDSS